MNSSDLNKLREAAWRRKLTPDEEAQLRTHLAVHTDVQAEWEDDLALTSALRALPSAPVDSNFTAQVMQAVKREKRSADQGPRVSASFLDVWHRFSTRLAWAGLILLAGASALLFYRNVNQQQTLARNVAKVSTLASLPGPEVLQDFEAINQLRYASSASDEALIEFLR
jgi:anti-sigma factor RsiW